MNHFVKPARPERAKRVERVPGKGLEPLSPKGHALKACVYTIPPPRHKLNYTKYYIQNTIYLLIRVPEEFRQAQLAYNPANLSSPDAYSDYLKVPR